MFRLKFFYGATATIAIVSLLAIFWPGIFSKNHSHYESDAFYSASYYAPEIKDSNIKLNKYRDIVFAGNKVIYFIRYSEVGEVIMSTKANIVYFNNKLILAEMFRSDLRGMMLPSEDDGLFIHAHWPGVYDAQLVKIQIVRADHDNICISDKLTGVFRCFRKIN